MPSPHKRTSIGWLRVLGAIGIALSLLLSAAVIWYLAAIEVPTTDRLESKVLEQDNAISILIRGSSSIPPHAIR